MGINLLTIFIPYFALPPAVILPETASQNNGAIEDSDNEEHLNAVPLPISVNNNELHSLGTAES